MTASSRRTTTAHDRETAKLSDIRRATEALLATNPESPSKSQQAPIQAARIPEMEWSESVWSWLSRPNHEDAVAPCLAAEVLDMDEVHPKNKCTQRYCSHIHVKNLYYCFSCHILPIRTGAMYACKTSWDARWNHEI